MNKGDEEDAEQEKNDPIIAHLWRVTSVEGGRGNIILMLLFHPNSCCFILIKRLIFWFSFWQFPNFKFCFLCTYFLLFFSAPA